MSGALVQCVGREVGAVGPNDGAQLAVHPHLCEERRILQRDKDRADLTLLKCAYEWGGQAAFWGPIAEVTEAECDALAIGTANDDRWSTAESALISAVDELEADGTWSDATWASLGETFDDEQRMELMIVVGWYRTICTLCNGMALPVEGWMRPWPSGA